MKALTLRHPWTFAIAYLGKDVENREWDDRLADLMGIHAQVGQRIAIHGGAAPQRPKRPTPLNRLAESNLWRQHCEDLQAVHRLLDGQLPDAAAHYLASHYRGQRLSPEMFICTGVIAVATVERVSRLVWPTSPWAVRGALNIELGDVQVLPSPVQCPGMQGLWSLPPSIEQDVREELTAWSRVQVPQDSGKTAREWLR